MPRRRPDPDWENLLLLVSHLLANAYAPSTLSNYTSTFRRYLLLCAHFHLPPLPPTATTVGLLIGDHFSVGNASTTIPSLLSHLKFYCYVFNSTWLSPRDIFLVRAIQRGFGKLRPHVPNRKLPLTLHLLHRLSTLIDASVPKRGQFLVMCFLAYETLFRYSELERLLLEDIEWLPDDRLHVTLKRSKPNQTGPPEHVYLSCRPGLCSVSLLRAYWIRHRLSLAPPKSLLFPDLSPRVPPGSRVPTKVAFTAYLRRLLGQLGVFTPERYSGHSFRSGGATDLWQSGFDLHTIQ